MRSDGEGATAAELRGLSRGELNTKVTELKEELFTLRFQAATGQLESHGRLRAVRKDIARIYTVLTERDLGIIDDPDAGVRKVREATSRRVSQTMRDVVRRGALMRPPQSGADARSARATWSATRWTRPSSSPSRTG